MAKKIGYFFVGIFVLVFAYNMIGQIFQAFKAGDRLTQEINKLATLEIKNKELKQQLTEVKSLEFIEKQARDKLGLAREGETVVVIPPDKVKQVLGISKDKEIAVKLPNWLGWLKLFLK